MQIDAEGITVGQRQFEVCGFPSIEAQHADIDACAAEAGAVEIPCRVPVAAAAVTPARRSLAVSQRQASNGEAGSITS